jgi:hypothetical protein
VGSLRVRQTPARREGSECHRRPRNSGWHCWSCCAQLQGDRALDVLREGVRLLAEALMELEVSEQVGAGRYERTPERKTYRNGYRERR